MPTLRNPVVPQTMIITTPNGQTWTEVASLDITALGNKAYLQGGYYHDGYWYLAQDVNGNTYIRRYRDSGSKGSTSGYLDTMVLVGGGHGSIIGIRNNARGKPEIWTVWKSRKRIARVPYVPGTIRVTNPGIRWVTNIKYAGNNCGIFEDWLFVRRVRSLLGLKWEDYALYSIHAIETTRGMVQPINAARVRAPGVYQGSAANGVHFTRLTGKTARRTTGIWRRGKVKWDKPHRIVFYDWASGKPVRTINCDDMGPRIDSAGNLEHVTSKEPEGMQYLRGKWLVGFRLGSTNNRRFRIFQL